MNPLNVAFSKFEMWKNSQTVLNLAVYTKGTDDQGSTIHWRGCITQVDVPELLLASWTQRPAQSCLWECASAPFASSSD